MGLSKWRHDISTAKVDDCIDAAWLSKSDDTLHGVADPAAKGVPVEPEAVRKRDRLRRA
jgi:hypothetical protein